MDSPPVRREAEFAEAMLWLVDHPAVFFVVIFTLLVVSARIGVPARIRGTS